MTSVKQIGCAVVLGAVVLIGASPTTPARAGFTVTLEQMGSNVVATGSGTIDLGDLGFSRNLFNDDGFIHPSDALLSVGVRRRTTSIPASPVRIALGVGLGPPPTASSEAQSLFQVSAKGLACR